MMNRLNENKSTIERVTTNLRQRAKRKRSEFSGFSCM